MAHDGHPVYHLRRVGTAATVAGVKDLLQLSDTVTKFGRHSGNDHFIDSATLSYFVSRWHAEIQCVRQDANSTETFVIRDKSLNGTYVNNRRVVGDHSLEEGDIVMFGHPCGTKIRPGDKAEVIQSEFIFVFEKASRCNSADNRPASVVSRYTLNDGNKNDTILYQLTTLSRSSTSKTNDRLQEKQDVNNSDRPASPVIPRLSSHKMAPAVSSAKRGKSGPSSSKGRLKDISNTSSRTADFMQGLKSLNKTKQSAKQSAKRPPNIEDNVPSTSEDEVFQLAIKSAQTFGSSDSQDSLDALPVFNSGISSLTTATSASSSSAIVNSVGVGSGEKKRGSESASRRPLLESRTTSEQKTSKQRKRKRRCEDVNESNGKKRLGTPEMDRLKWHDAGERCHSFDCCQPKANKVSWVQCDDCDQWYHTECVGCNYKSVSQLQTEFHCGCT